MKLGFFCCKAWARARVREREDLSHDVMICVRQVQADKLLVLQFPHKLHDMYTRPPCVYLPWYLRSLSLSFTLSLVIRLPSTYVPCMHMNAIISCIPGPPSHPPPDISWLSLCLFALHCRRRPMPGCAAAQCVCARVDPCAPYLFFPLHPSVLILLMARHVRE